MIVAGVSLALRCISIGLLAVLVMGCEPDSGGPVQPVAEVDPVLATVDGEPITTRDLIAAIEAVPKPDRLDYLAAEARRDLLETLIDRRLMAREARQRSLSPVSIQGAGLHDQPATETRLAQAYLDARLAELPEPTAEEIKAYYAANPDEFRVPARVRVTRLVFDDRARADAALAAARGGAALETLGDRNVRPVTLWLQRGADEQTAFEQAAFATAPGEPGPIVPVATGFCVFRVEERHEAARQPLTAVTTEIRARLRAKRRAALLQRMIDELRETAVIEIDSAALAAFGWDDQAS